MSVKEAKQKTYILEIFLSLFLFCLINESGLENNEKAMLNLVCIILKIQSPTELQAHR